MAEAPYPFGASDPIKGLPVIDVDDTIAVGDTFDWDSGIDLLRAPRRKQRYDINLRFYDTEDGILEKFFERWFNAIYDSEKGVLPLSTACKQLTIKKLTSERKIIFSRDYLVFPYGTLMGVNKLDSGPRQYDIGLVVAAYANPLKFTQKAGETDSSKLNVLQKPEKYIYGGSNYEFIPTEGMNGD